MMINKIKWNASQLGTGSENLY